MLTRLAALALLALLLPSAAQAYVGPGAGFAFLGSFLSLLLAFVLGAASLLVWPIRVFWRAVTRRQGFKKAKVKRVIFLGLDGLDADLIERMLNEGRLPNMASMRQKGRYSRLRTTYPALSPVAWATFATGVNPGKHNLFDFLNRSFQNYLPELSSSRVNAPKPAFRIGKWQWVRGGGVEMRRKSQPFWKILGDESVGSTIIRVPITFPPEKFHGRALSAMCTPDLLGTQGSFLHFTTKSGRVEFEDGGNTFPLERKADAAIGVIEGPTNPLSVEAEPLRIPFEILPNGTPQSRYLKINGNKHLINEGEYTPWMRLTFNGGPGAKVKGVCRMLLTETEPEVSLYLTPINIDPESPALPISHPSYYATYLAKLLGTYSTLGLAEDTWALNERVIDEDDFLEQAYDIADERLRMFENALAKTKQGVVTCVFDTPDRVQHMFYRYREPEHPAHPHNGGMQEKYAGVIEDLYERMDVLVGKALQAAGEEDIVFALSDHGFKSFQRGVNLNTWLRDNGYLVLKDGADEAGPYLRGIDWDKTRAYTFGLAGIYFNLEGREAKGIVKSGADAKALARELCGKLTGLRDEERDTVAVHRAYPKEEVYSGPYSRVAPDVVVGYNVGYRAGWDAALGRIGGPIFQDNTKAWSGDHSIDPPLIPGVLFCNRKFDDADPGIEDLAPTALDLFGFEPPKYMDGQALHLVI